MKKPYSTTRIRTRAMSGPGAADLQRAGIQPPQTGTTNKGDPFKMMMDQLLTRFDQSDAKLIKVGSDVAGINENIRGMQNQIANNRNDIAAISEQVNDLKRSNKDEVANQVAAELRRAGVGAGASAEIDKLIQEKMRRVDKEIDKASNNDFFDIFSFYVRIDSVSYSHNSQQMTIFVFFPYF